MAKSQKDERRPLVLDLYVNQQLSATAIERQTGISTTAIYNILREASISPAALRDSGERVGKQGGTHRFPPEIEQQMIAEYKAGGSYHGLAEKYDCSVPLIRRVLNRHGEAPRRRGGMGKKLDPELAKQITRDWNSGMSQHAMGIKYHCHQSTISNVLRRLNIEPEQRQLFGADHHSWKTGRVKMSNDYTFVRISPQHPYFQAMAQMNGYVAEHRLVMAEFLGRPLEDHETVHHKDGDTSNNTLTNLQLRQGKHGTGVVYHCADCGSFNVVAQTLADPLDGGEPS
jgi:Mor family transcriptional regulator